MDPIFYASVTTYRVVVSHNPQNPDVFYVDMCRDGFCSHDLLFKMQKKFYRNDKLERVFNDSKGIFLKEYRADGHIALLYTKHRDVMAQRKQAKIREKVDPEIIRVFKQMKAEDKIQTISVQTAEFYYAGEQKKLPIYPCNLQQETIMEEAERLDKIKKLNEIKQAYYAKQRYASCPQIMLAWKQAVRSGN